MAVRLRRADSFRSDSPSSPRGTWLLWLQQIASLVYLLGGILLLYQWKRLHRDLLLVSGILFMVYGVCRFFLIRQRGRRQ